MLAVSKDFPMLGQVKKYQGRGGEACCIAAKQSTKSRCLAVFTGMRSKMAGSGFRAQEPVLDWAGTPR